jgi:hypothetical protein
MLLGGCVELYDTKPRQENHQSDDSEKKLNEQTESIKADER